MARVNWERLSAAAGQKNPNHSNLLKLVEKEVSKAKMSTGKSTSLDLKELPLEGPLPVFREVSLPSNVPKASDAALTAEQLKKEAPPPAELQGVKDEVIFLNDKPSAAAKQAVQVAAQSSTASFDKPETPFQDLPSLPAKTQAVREELKRNAPPPAEEQALRAQLNQNALPPGQYQSASARLRSIRQEKIDAMPPFSRRVYIIIKNDVPPESLQKIQFASKVFTDYNKELKKLQKQITAASRYYYLRNLSKGITADTPDMVECLRYHLESGTEPLVVMVDSLFDFDPNPELKITFDFNNKKLPYDKFTPHKTKHFNHTSIYLKWHGWYSKLLALSTFPFKRGGKYMKAFQLAIYTLVEKDELLQEKQRNALNALYDAQTELESVQGSEEPEKKYKLRQKVEKLKQKHEQAKKNLEDFHDGALAWADRWIFNTYQTRVDAGKWLSSVKDLVPSISSKGEKVGFGRL